MGFTSTVLSLDVDKQLQDIMGRFFQGKDLRVDSLVFKQPPVLDTRIIL